MRNTHELEIALNSVAFFARRILILIFKLLWNQPLFKLSLSPDSLLLSHTVGICDASDAMLHAINPFAAVLTAIGICVRSISVLLVVLIIALIPAAILPLVASVAVHHTVQEGALEVTSVCPLEASIAVHLIVRPVACVLGAISPEVDTSTFLHALLEVAMVVAAV